MSAMMPQCSTRLNMPTMAQIVLQLHPLMAVPMPMLKLLLELPLPTLPLI